MTGTRIFNTLEPGSRVMPQHGRIRRHRWRAVLAALTALFLYVPLPSVTADTAGLPVIALRLRDLGLFSTLSVSLVLVGVWLLIRLRASRKVASIELAASYVVGQGAVGAFLLLVGLLGFFDGTILQGIAIAIPILAASEQVVARVVSQLQQIRSTLALIGSNTPGKALIWGVGAVTFIFLVMSLGPTVTVDGPMYHVGLPADFLREGRIFLPDDNLHLAFIAAPHMILAIPLSVGTTAYLAFSQVGSLVLLIFLVAGVVQRWISTHAARLAVPLLFAATGLLYVSHFDQVDMSFVVATLVCLFWVVAMGADREVPNLAFLGLIVGGALLTKYQAIPFLIGVAMVFIWSVVSRRVRLELVDALAGVVFAVLLYVPFILKNEILVGVPLYPFLTERISYPWLGSMGWELRDVHEVFATLKNAREPFNLADYLISPGDLTVEQQGLWFGFPPIFLLGVGALFTKHRQIMAQLLVVASVGLGLTVLVSQATNLRYILPVFPLFAIMTATAVAKAVPDGRTFIRRLIVSGVVVAGLVTSATWFSEALIHGGRLNVGAGIESEDEWLERPAMTSNRHIRGLSRHLSSEQVDDAARVLLFYEARGFYLKPNVIQDNGMNNWLMLRVAIGDECLDSTEISHVVVGTSTLGYLRWRGLTAAQLKLSEFADFSRRCLDEIASIEGYEIYAVRGG